MFLSDFSIKRPVVAIVASLLLVVFGVYAMLQLPIRETPNIDQPMVNIGVGYNGASAEVVESKVVKVIEDQVSGIPGVKSISAQARDGRGNVNIEFDLSRNIDDAANDVRDKVSRVINRLPEDAEAPQVTKADPDSDPILMMDLSAGAHTLLDLADIGEFLVKPELSAIDGVASVGGMGGGGKKSMRIWLDRRAMAARGITEADIENSLRRENVELGAGELESTERSFTLRTLRSYQKPEDFAQLVIGRGPNNYLIRLGEVATVEIGPEDDKSVVRKNGQLTIGVSVVKQPGASTLAVAQAVKDELSRIGQILPPDVTLSTAIDNSLFIAAALHEVEVAILVAAVMVIAVIYLFLGSLRAAIIPAVTVPISLIATAIVLWPLGFSINILTLLAMVLAIGLVVDDAIIMVENIHRRMKQQGEPPLLAAYRGARQVGMAVVSTTFVLMAVFVPITLMKGTIGGLFKEFAVSMAVAVGCSLFVALTLTPVMCSKILSNKLDEGAVAHGGERIFDAIKAFYGKVLRAALDAPRRVFIAFFVIITATIGMFFVIPQEFTPREDRGGVNIQVRAPEGASVDYLDRQGLAAAEILKPYLDSGEIERMIQMVNAAGAFGNITVRLAPWEKRTRSVDDFVREIQPKLQRIPGALITVSVPAALGRGGGGFGGGGGGANVIIGGPTYDDLRVWRDKMINALRDAPRPLVSRSNFNDGKPQMQIRIDRNRAADMGVSINTIGQTLAVMLGSRRVTTYETNGQEYYVILQGKLEDRRTPSDVSNIYVRSDTTRQLIPLSGLVNIEESAFVDNLSRFNRMRAITLNFFPSPDYVLSDLIRDVEQIAKEQLPSTARLTWRGEAGEYKETSGYIYMSFGLALIVVFLVLAAQFESFVHPLVIMMTVPLAMAGAIFGLLVFGQSINIYSQIGIIVLVGLAAKNGILIVEFTNQLRDAGMKFRDALTEATLIRLRPIIMTGLATVMGALPLVIATGAGAEGRRAIGVVIMTGVALASFVTLLVIPVFYQLLARKTGSPGRVATELAGYEKGHPAIWQGEGEGGPSPGRQAAE